MILGTSLSLVLRKIRRRETHRSTSRAGQDTSGCLSREALSSCLSAGVLGQELPLISRSRREGRRSRIYVLNFQPTLPRTWNISVILSCSFLSETWVSPNNLLYIKISPSFIIYNRPPPPSRCIKYTTSRPPPTPSPPLLQSPSSQP